MSITPGAVVAKSDLDALTNAALALCAADAVQLPLGGEVAFLFPGLTATLLSASPQRCKAVFVAPYDLLLETVALIIGDTTAASTSTVTVLCPGILDAFPTSVGPVTGGAGQTKGTRNLFDNSTKGTDRCVRVIPKGATVELDVTTTSAAAASLHHVVLAYRQFFARS